MGDIASLVRWERASSAICVAWITSCDFLVDGLIKFPVLRQHVSKCYKLKAFSCCCRVFQSYPTLSEECHEMIIHQEICYQGTDRPIKLRPTHQPLAPVSEGLVFDFPFLTIVNQVPKLRAFHPNHRAGGSPVCPNPCVHKTNSSSSLCSFHSWWFCNVSLINFLRNCNGVNGANNFWEKLATQRVKYPSPSAAKRFIDFLGSRSSNAVIFRGAKSIFETKKGGVFQETQ